MLSGPLVKPPLGDQDVTRYPHGRTWYITSVVLLLYMVAPPQGSIRRRMGFGVEESEEIGKLCRHRAAEDARCRCCVSVSQHAHCEVIGPLERRNSVAVLVLLRTGIQTSVSVIGILSDPTGSLRGALTVIVTHYPHGRTCITSFLLFRFGFIIFSSPHGSVERRWLSTFVNVRKVWVVPHWASW